MELRYQISPPDIPLVLHVTLPCLLFLLQCRLACSQQRDTLIVSTLLGLAGNNKQQTQARLPFVEGTTVFDMKTSNTRDKDTTRRLDCSGSCTKKARTSNQERHTEQNRTEQNRTELNTANENTDGQTTYAHSTQHTAHSAHLQIAHSTHAVDAHTQDERETRGGRQVTRDERQDQTCQTCNYPGHQTPKLQLQARNAKSMA